MVVGGTRLVFDGTKNNAVITVENKDQNSNIVQSWLSVIDAASPAKDAFIITPPLFRLKAGEKGFVRVVRSGKKLPDDRESMFWLNIKGIPATEYVPDKNVVQFAINSKIKLIYRPAALKVIHRNRTLKNYSGERGDVGDGKNNSPLYMNFSQVSLNGKNISGAWFAAPFSTLKIPVQSSLSATGKRDHMERD
ncbi:fimbria/pilus periplasmic chaperone [Klebsiella pneumoniae subsp. pneumoniae]|nr:fimbria/pilus periplasmic chaperone [Klebsiella pneumoniae subsp. pneumoniae]